MGCSVSTFRIIVIIDGVKIIDEKSIKGSEIEVVVNNKRTFLCEKSAIITLNSNNICSVKYYVNGKMNYDFNIKTDN